MCPSPVGGKQQGGGFVNKGRAKGILTMLIIVTMVLVLAAPLTLAAHHDQGEVLQAYGFAKAEINQLKEQGFDQALQQLLESGDISVQDAKRLAAQIIRSRPAPVTPKEVPPGERSPHPLFLDSNGDVGIAAGCQGGGAHRILKSTSGKNQVTGWAELPTSVNVTYDPCSPRPNQQNDMPYMFFGVYNGQAGGGADVGLFYDASVTGWKPFIYTLPLNGSSVWDEGSVVIRRPTVPYLHLRVMDNALRLRVIDSGSWTLIFDRTWSLPNRGFRADGYGHQLTREVSLAQHKENLANGAYLTSAHWYDVWIYWTTNQARWTSTYTASGYPVIQPSYAAGKVTTSNVYRDYEDTVSIDYR